MSRNPTTGWVRGRPDESIDYSITVSGGLAWLRLPVELTATDAKQIAAMLEPLAFDDAVVEGWRARRLAESLASTLAANLITLWRMAPTVAARISVEPPPLKGGRR